MSAASALPSWLLLDPFVFDRSFPDDTKAPIRASGTSSGGDSFRIAFSVAKPPQISRLYAQLPLPEGSTPSTWKPVRVVASHHHLALVCCTTEFTETPKDFLYLEQLEVQNLFILDATDHCNSCSSSLKLKELPACTKPDNDFSLNPRRILGVSRFLDEGSLGLWCRSGEEEFVVAELTTLDFPSLGPGNHKAFADMCLLRSSSSSTSSSDAAAMKLGGEWELMRVEIMSTHNCDDEDLWRLRHWETNTVVPFQQWLCWIDYSLGIIFCDMSQPRPTISYLWFPLDMFRCRTCFLYCGVSVVNHGRALKFVRIIRSDGEAMAPLKPCTCTGFTITCHTLVLGAAGEMEWNLDYKVTSTELWEANPTERLPRTVVIFPQVDIHRPQVLHLVAVEFVYIQSKMWLVSIDMSTKTVESCSLYMDGTTECCCFQADEEAAWYLIKSHCPEPFIPCEFPKFLHLSRKRKELD